MQCGAEFSVSSTTHRWVLHDTDRHVVQDAHLRASTRTYTSTRAWPATLGAEMKCSGISLQAYIFRNRVCSSNDEKYLQEGAHGQRPKTIRRRDHSDQNETESAISKGILAGHANAWARCTRKAA
eukprot:6182690-Pleurochrysis_carterae.AAC.3